MKKSELKKLIKEIVEETMKQGKVYSWQDGTEIVLDQGNHVTDITYKGKKLDLSGWKDFGWSNGWEAGFYENEIAPKIGNERGYQIKVGRTDTMDVFPQAKVSFMSDSSG